MWNPRALRRLSLRHFGALLVTVLVVGCSASGTLTMLHPKSQTIPPGKTVALSVQPDAANPKPIFQEVATRVRDSLYGKLVSNGLFKAVVQPTESADYRMEVKVFGARQVSTGARIWLGVMAGSNSLALRVEVIDESTNLVVTAFEVAGSSASHPLSSEAGLDDALREATDKLVLALR